MEKITTIYVELDVFPKIISIFEHPALDVPLLSMHMSLRHARRLTYAGGVTHMTSLIRTDGRMIRLDMTLKIRPPGKGRQVVRVVLV